MYFFFLLLFAWKDHNNILNSEYFYFLFSFWEVYQLYLWLSIDIDFNGVAHIWLSVYEASIFMKQFALQNVKKKKKKTATATHTHAFECFLLTSWTRKISAGSGFLFLLQHEILCYARDRMWIDFYSQRQTKWMHPNVLRLVRSCLCVVCVDDFETSPAWVDSDWCDRRQLYQHQHMYVRYNERRQSYGIWYPIRNELFYHFQVISSRGI